MSYQNFTFQPDTAWESHYHDLPNGDKLMIGTFENVLRPEGAPRGFACAMCRQMANEDTWEMVMVSARFFKNTFTEFQPASKWVGRAKLKFNDWLDENYGADANLNEFQEFIADISNGLREFRLEGYQFV